MCFFFFFLMCVFKKNFRDVMHGYYRIFGKFKKHKEKY